MSNDTAPRMPTAWGNTMWALDECEKAYKQYLDDRQGFYKEITLDSGDAERQYANNETARAHSHYLESRKKIYEELAKKGRELRGRITLEDDQHGI
jgi:hypothetical protein